MGQVADCGAFLRTDLRYLFVGWRSTQFNVSPARTRIGGNDLHRLVELLAEPGRQVWMTAGHGLHRIAQAVLVERTGNGDVQLHDIQIVVGSVCGAAVKDESLLQGGQRQDVGHPVLPGQLVDLLLAEPCRRDVRRGQTAAAVTHVLADAGQRVQPQLIESADLCFVDCRTRPGPVGPQLWTGSRVDRAGIQRHGVGQRHGYGRGHAGDRQTVGGHLPQLAAGFGGSAAEATEVVESGGGIGCVEVDIRIEVAQDPVGQRIGQSPKLFLGTLDHGAQRRVTGDHVGPGQTGHRQCHRVFRGEPPDRARQVDVFADFFVAPVPFDIERDRTVRAGELGQCEPVGDQENVGHPGMEGRRHLAEQHAGGLGVKGDRQLPGGRIGIHLGAYRRQHRRRRGDLSPLLGPGHHVRFACVGVQQLGPPCERRPRRRQRDGLSTAMLRPGDVEVFQDDSPRHPVDRQMMDDQQQLSRRGHP
nr:hypothetical protein CPGR_06023 [Mycolicibacterium fortuitum subsp. fortuitum DSM 46621 = ATCC 6841 = JCM 6387]